MIKGAAEQGLKRPSLQFQIFARIKAGLLRFAQRFGARCSEADDEVIGPCRGQVFHQVASFRSAQVENEHGGAGLLQDDVEALGRLNLPYFGQAAGKGLDSPNEFGVLAVDNADRGKDHAATTSLSKRTSGSRIWNAVPFCSSL